MITSYSMTGKNPSLSGNQFIQPTNPAYAWNMEVWDTLLMGGPIDAPDHISAGACDSNWASQIYILRP